MLDGAANRCQFELLGVKHRAPPVHNRCDLNEIAIWPTKADRTDAIPLHASQGPAHREPQMKVAQKDDSRHVQLPLGRFQATAPVIRTSHGNNDLSSAVTFFKIPEGIRDFAQCKRSVDDRRELAGLDELFHE